VETPRGDRRRVAARPTLHLRSAGGLERSGEKLADEFSCTIEVVGS
jgi:hypothetical protein